MDDQAITCPKCGERQLYQDARYCHSCGEPLTAAAPAPSVTRAVRKGVNPLAWMVPVTLLAAAAVLVLLWQVVLGDGFDWLTPRPNGTPTQMARVSPEVTLAPTATPRDHLPLPQPTVTFTALPSLTLPTPTSPTPGPSPTPSPYGHVSGTEGELLNVRTGPGTDYEIVTQLEEGATVLILGRDAADAWLRIRTPSGLQGWVARQYITNDMPGERLPVFTPEPTPMPTATLAGDPHFVAERLELTRGECTRLSWSVEGVRSVHLEGSGTTGQGSLEVCPAETHTYTLRVVQNDGTLRDWTVTVSVVGSPITADYTLEPRGCIAHDMQLGQVKGQVFDRNGNVVSNAGVTITVDGQAGVVPEGRTNEAGWYEFNLKDGQVARFVALTVAGQPEAFAPVNYEVKARSGCYQRVDFRQN